VDRVTMASQLLSAQMIHPLGILGRSRSGQRHGAGGNVNTNPRMNAPGRIHADTAGAPARACRLGRPWPARPPRAPLPPNRPRDPAQAAIAPGHVPDSRAGRAAGETA